MSSSLHKRNKRLRFLCLWGLVPGIIVVILLIQHGAGWASPAHGPATVFAPNHIGGSSGHNDGRDADLYPALAYDRSTSRYLAVWMTARNAQSPSAGFDVYGVFLDRTGQPVGSEFRISDSSTAARNGLPAVVAGNGEFVVAWTTRGASCQIHGQRVTDASSRPDRVLIAGPDHRHSPSLVYNPVVRRYVLVFVAGDDYLPPTLFGAPAADCGNNASSTSRIQVMDFYFDADNLVAGTPAHVSDASAGTFRPRLAYSAALDQYLAVWEDRRNAAGQTYRFDVYAQRLAGDMTIMDGDIAVATGGDYTNFDASATWTPRPVVAAGGSRFLVAWFNRQVQDSVVIWSVAASLVPASGTPGTPFTVAHMPFAQPHAGQSPTGFLAAAYATTVQEVMVGMTSHLESVWGYLSFALVQRVGSDGQLLNVDGSPQSDPGVGSSVDYERDDQIAIGMVVNPVGGAGAADYMLVYGKHSVDQPVYDFEIWGVRIRLPAPCLIYLPLVSRGT